MNRAKPKRTLSNQSGDPVVSIKSLFKEPSPDKYCQNCGSKFDNTDKWKQICTKCWLFSKINNECMF